MNQFFVFINGISDVMREENEEVALFASIKEAYSAAQNNLACLEMGFEVFKLGNGEYQE